MGCGSGGSEARRAGIGMRFLREVAPGESGQDRGIGRQKGLLSRVWDRVRRRDAPSGGAVPHQPVGINHGSAAARWPLTSGVAG